MAVTSDLSGFLPTCIQGMRNLHAADRSNIIQGLVNCVGLPNDCGDVSRLPLNGMPTGYIEHQIQYFNSSHRATVHQLIHLCHMQILFVLGASMSCRLSGMV